MGWAVGFDWNWGRDVGYGVPAWCDWPGCGVRIDRGLAHVCGGEPFGGGTGCGLYFCEAHLVWGAVQVCEACAAGWGPFVPSSDHPEWVRHKLTDVSWVGWRWEHPGAVVDLYEEYLA